MCGDDLYRLGIDTDLNDFDPIELAKAGSSEILNGNYDLAIVIFAHLKERVQPD